MSDGDPHHRTERIRKTIQEVEKTAEISDHNTEFILDFKQYLESQGLSLDRISRYLYSLKKVAKNIDWKLEEPTKDEVMELAENIHQSKYWDKEIADATKCEYKKLIRKLYKDYLSKKKDIDGEELTDFFSVTAKTNFADPEELPKPHHIAKMVKNRREPRDKAFIMQLWSSAGRISAVLGCRWSDIRLSSKVATINFRDTKTGEDRKVPVVSGYPYLRRYKETDPLGANPDAFLFRPLNSTDPEEQLSYNGAKGIIERAAEEADIPEHIKINPHAFRKGRISDLARKNFSEAQISRISGHTLGGKELRVYCRLASEDVESNILKEAGLEPDKDEVEEDPLRPKKCPNESCCSLNKWEAEVCDSCETVLRESELFQKMREEEIENDFKDRVIEKQTEWSPEEISEEIDKLVEKKPV